MPRCQHPNIEPAKQRSNQVEHKSKTPGREAVSKPRTSTTSSKAIEREAFATKAYRTNTSQARTDKPPSPRQASRTPMSTSEHKHENCSAQTKMLQCKNEDTAVQQTTNVAVQERKCCTATTQILQCNIWPQFGNTQNNVVETANVAVQQRRYCSATNHKCCSARTRTMNCNNTDTAVQHLATVREYTSKQKDSKPRLRVRFHITHFLGLDGLFSQDARCIVLL